MFNVVVFETAEEFFKACSEFRERDDTSPSIPNTVRLIISGNDFYLEGEGANKFDFDKKQISRNDLIVEAFRLADMEVEIQ